MHKLINKEVEVMTVDISYKGILVEIGEQDIYLQTETGWTVVPVEKVVDIKLAS